MLFAGGAAQQLGIALRFLIGQGLYGQIFAGELQLIQDGFILLVGDDLLIFCLVFFVGFSFFVAIIFSRFSYFFVAIFCGGFACIFVVVFFSGFGCLFAGVFFGRFGCFFVAIFFSGLSCFFVAVFFGGFSCFFVAIFFSRFGCFFVVVFFSGFGCLFVNLFFGGFGCFFVAVFFGQFIFVIILVFVLFGRSFFIIYSIVLIGGFLVLLGGVGFGFSGRGGFTLLGITGDPQLGFGFLLGQDGDFELAFRGAGHEGEGQVILARLYGEEDLQLSILRQVVLALLVVPSDIHPSFRALGQQGQGFRFLHGEAHGGALGGQIDLLGFADQHFLYFVSGIFLELSFLAGLTLGILGGFLSLLGGVRGLLVGGGGFIRCLFRYIRVRGGIFPGLSGGSILRNRRNRIFRISDFGLIFVRNFVITIGVGLFLGRGCIYGGISFLGLIRLLGRRIPCCYIRRNTPPCGHVFALEGRFGGVHRFLGRGFGRSGLIFIISRLRSRDRGLLRRRGGRAIRFGLSRGVCLSRGRVVRKDGAFQDHRGGRRVFHDLSRDSATVRPKQAGGHIAHHHDQGQDCCQQSLLPGNTH